MRKKIFVTGFVTAEFGGSNMTGAAAAGAFGRPDPLRKAFSNSGVLFLYNLRPCIFVSGQRRLFSRR
jgi:hypothetical protein